MFVLVTDLVTNFKKFSKYAHYIDINTGSSPIFRIDEGNPVNLTILRG